MERFFNFLQTQMYSFDPAINYGPNDAGVSALSIALVSLGVLLTLSLLGAVYGQISKIFNSDTEQDKD